MPLPACHKGTPYGNCGSPEYSTLLLQVLCWHNRRMYYMLLLLHC
jgi:hypothetical protein